MHPPKLAALFAALIAQLAAPQVQASPPRVSLDAVPAPVNETAAAAMSDVCKPLAETPDGLPQQTFTFGHHTIHVAVEETADGAMRIAAHEGTKPLWHVDKDDAGGANPGFCVRDGWSVVLVYKPRFGTLVVDALSGKPIAETADPFVFAADGTWGLAPPRIAWGTNCLVGTQLTRVALTGTHATRALAIKPIAGADRCGDDGPLMFAMAAIAPKGNRFAYLSPTELTLYDTATNRVLTTMPLPAELAGNASRISFSASGDHVVIMSADEPGTLLRYRIAVHAAPTAKP